MASGILKEMSFLAIDMRANKAIGLFNSKGGMESRPIRLVRYGEGLQP